MTDLGLSRPTPRVLPPHGVLRKAGDTNVVFIHGILSNSVGAWTAENGVAWPHLLEDELTLGDVGIFMFGYATGVMTGTYSVEQVTTVLHEFLLREGLLDKPRLLIVAHSMGGIVTRRWMVQHVVNLAERNIALGVLLVASPSLGSGYANVLQELNAFLGNSQLTGLEAADRNQMLDGLDRDFRRLLDDGTLTIVGREIVEDQPPSFLAYLTSASIVGKYSANRYFADAVTVSGSNHMTVCKPQDRDAIQHTVLLNLMDRLVAAGPPVKVLYTALLQMRDAFRERGEYFLAAVNAACVEVGSTLSQQDWRAVLRLRVRFEELMRQHLELIAAGKLAEADVLRVREIAPTRDDLIALIDDRSGTLSRDLFGRLNRHYLDTPELGLDRDYDAARFAVGGISSAVDALKAARYEV